MTYLGAPRIDSSVPYAIGRKILATFGPSGLGFRGGRVSFPSLDPKTRQRRSWRGIGLCRPCLRRMQVLDLAAYKKHRGEHAARQDQDV